MHRITKWCDDAGDVRQVSICCLDDAWEPVAEVTERVGPFDDVDEVLADALARAHALGGWRAHQLSLL